MDEKDILRMKEEHALMKRNIENMNLQIQNYVQKVVDLESQVRSYKMIAENLSVFFRKEK